MDLSSPEIFQYPFLYISEAGEMDLTDKEVLNFREYIDRGGFVMVDDFDGIPDLTVFRRNMQRVFPERDIFPMPDDYPLLHTFYDIDELEVLAPYDVAGKPTFYGFPDGRGGTSMFICYNNDVGDFWEWIDQPRYG